MHLSELTHPPVRIGRFFAACFAALALAACGSTDNLAPPVVSDSLQFTATQVQALDSTAQIIVQANPGNADLKSLVDSTLLVLTAGVQAKRLDVNTNLTTAPLYFVGVHRTVSRASGSFSTWTLVGIDDPSHLANVVEVSGFAQTSNAAAPVSVSGTIGDGSGSVNAMFLQVGSGGTVTQWPAATGTASFTSGAAGATCPGFTPTPLVTCALETMHVHFSANATSGSGGAGARQASLATDVDVPAMRLTFTPP